MYNKHHSPDNKIRDYYLTKISIFFYGIFYIIISYLKQKILLNFRQKKCADCYEKYKKKKKNILINLKQSLINL